MRRPGSLLLVLAGLAAAGAALAASAPVLYRHFFMLPRLERDIAALQLRRSAAGAAPARFSDLRVILHAHTRRSFDSQGKEENLALAAAASGVRAVFLSEHPAAGMTVQIPAAEEARELHGVLLVPGMEFRPGAVTVWSRQALSLPSTASWERVRASARARALVFLSHPQPGFQVSEDLLTGLEVYNAHDDAREESLWRVAPQMLISRRRYADLIGLWLMDEPRARLRLWDRLLSRGRPVVGVGGNDAHEGLGVELRAGSDGVLRLRTSGGLPMKSVRVGSVLARLLGGEVGDPARADEEPGGGDGRLLFRIVADPYEASFRLVSTHLLSRCGAVDCLYEALETGRAYVSFDRLGDPSGFGFEASGEQSSATMGGSIRAARGLVLEARSPLPALLRLLRDGALASEADGHLLRHPIDGPGVYRLEAFLKPGGRRPRPWVLTNPIYVVPPAGGPEEGPLLRKAEHLRRVLEARHVPEGLVLNTFLDAAGGPARYQDFGDQAIWSGIYVMACAQRALVTRRPRDIAELMRAARALRTLHAVTGQPGLLARGLQGPSAPGGEEGLRWFPGAPGFRGFRWAADLSKDQLIGFVYGSAAAYEAARALGAPELSEVAKGLGEDLRLIVRRLAANGWVIRDPDGRPARHGDLSPGVWGLRLNGLNALLALATARAAATLSGGRDVESLYRDELVGRLAYPYLVRRRLWVDFGAYTRYDNFNMAFLGLHTLLTLETDPELLRLYARALRERLWEGRVSGHRNPFFTYIALSAWQGEPEAGALGLEDTRALAEALVALDEFPWTLRNRRVEPPSRLPLSWLRDRRGRLRAANPAPVYLRPPSAFLWKEDPHRVEGGAGDGREFPGVDYLAAYWLGRRQGLVPGAEQEARRALVGVAGEGVLP